MDLLQSLETYASAQKWVGINVIILGAVLLVFVGIIGFFAAKSPMATGVKWAALVAGLFIIMGGISYLRFNNQIRNDGATLFQKSKTEFVEHEHARMVKVESGVFTYQLVFAALIVASLLVILFVKAPAIKGVAFVLAFLFLGQLLIEEFSHASIVQYTQELRQELQAQGD